MYEFAVTPAVNQIRRRGVTITDVGVGSIGAELELEPGDRIMRVNGRVVRDYLDFRFQSSGETDLVFDVRKHTGEDWELNIERDEAEDFGLGFEQIVPRQCERMPLLFLQRQSGNGAPIIVRARRRCAAVVPLWELHDADVDQ